MKSQAKDYRPKILSFQHNLTGLKIASQRNILWPCHAFRVSIPARRKKELNIFEETVLKLCSTGTCDNVKLADKTCLNSETVKFIQYRLLQLNLLNDHFELTEDAKKLIRQMDNEPEEYMAASVYVDLIEGNLLTVVLSETPKYENVIQHRNGDGHIKFEVGSTGNKKNISALQLLPQGLCMSKIPTADDVVKTIKAYMKLAKLFSLLTDKNNNLPSFYPKSEAITVQKEPEIVFLHCRVLVQKGNPDFLVTDAFGYGFSSVFKKALTSKAKGDNGLNAWIVSLKKKGIIKNIRDQESGGQRSDAKNISGFSAIRSQSEAKKRLNRAKSKLLKAEKLHVTSSSQEGEKRQLISGFFKDLYDSIEWAFRQIVFNNPVDHWEKIFSSQSYKNNDRLLRECAKKIGFTIPKSGNSLLQVTPGKIRAFSKGCVEMQPLLALAIAGASQNIEHPLNFLAVNDSSTLLFITELKAFRDREAHGQILDLCKMPDKLKRYLEQTRKIVSSIFPTIVDVEEEIDGWGAHIEHPDNIDQRRLSAVTNLENFFGTADVSTMDSNLKEQLIRIELFGDSNGNTQGKVNAMASALQIVLNTTISGFFGHVNTDQGLRMFAHTKCIEANFKLFENRIPQCIQTSKEKSIILACRGISQSLQANLMAFLILMPKKDLAIVSRQFPDMLNFIAGVINLRGHGNYDHKLLSKNDLLKLKEDVFRVLKILLEI